MTITVINETEIQYDFSYEEVTRRVVEHVLSAEGFPFEACVDITLVDDEAIHKLNLEHRGIDRPTDVLSFPMIDYQSAADFEGIGAQEENFDPDTGEALLGDIVIDLEKVKYQAEEYGHSLLREYAFLLCHSMLHLLGYDHIESDQEQVMYKRQDELLEELNITRDE